MVFSVPLCDFSVVNTFATLKPMRQYFVIIIISALPLSICAQVHKPVCSCGNNKYSLTEEDTSFVFSNGEALALCRAGNGTHVTQDKISYGGFILYDCRPGVFVNEYFDMFSSFQVSLNQDTFIVEQVDELPVGKHFEFRKTVWKIEKIFYVDGNLTRVILSNPEFPKYSKARIDSVKKSFENQATFNEYEVEDMFYRLMVAAIAGDEQAFQYFTDFRKKFPLDGAYAMSYTAASNILALYKKK
jgi:hypothetical protein